MLISPIHRFDGFTSTFQDKLFKGYDMEIHNQIFYTTLCSCVLSLTGKNPSIYSILGMIICFTFTFDFFEMLFTDWLLVVIDFFLFGLGLILQGHLLPAIDFVYRHNDCFLDIALLSTVSDLCFPVLV